MNMSRVERYICLTACLVCFLSTPMIAYAQEENPETIQLNKEATEHFRNKQYPQAAKKFSEAAKKASTKKSAAVLVKNAMIAWYSAKDCTKAITSANDFLNSAKYTKLNDNDIVDAHTVISKCRLAEAETALEKNDIKASEKAFAIAKTHAKKEADIQSVLAFEAKLGAKKKALAKKNEKKGNKIVKPPNPKAAESGLSTKGIVGISLMGVGAAGIVGTMFWADGRNEANTKAFKDFDPNYDEDKNEIDCGGQSACTERLKEVESERTLQYVGIGVGSALVLGGATLLILDLVAEKEPEPTKTTFFPVVGKGHAGAGMLFRF